MKLFFALFRVFTLGSLFSVNFGEETQHKSVIDFLTHYGDELMASTDQFLHEQRRLGHEDLLKNLEKHNIDLELFLIELRNVTAESKESHEIHQLELKLFNLESLISEEILHVKNLTGANTAGPTTVSPVTQKLDPRVLVAEDVLSQAVTALQSYQGGQRQYIEGTMVLIRSYVQSIRQGNLTGENLSTALRQMNDHTERLRYVIEHLHFTVVTTEIPQKTTVKLFFCSIAGKVADPDDPTIYHYCTKHIHSHNWVHSVYHCPAGQVFNEKIQNCEH